ncbi:conserved hypothetical protein [Clostridium botulinum B str. Eklund 17B (NRP)]|uniref:Uncharacterized protein n=1 Tax=Clostridium botulinum (strain Eklund 17B / Type B) TaxID=935198 RepID=B2TRL6_CLOBB|nr:conserved hypothetical protein [Clostridium botulinum B str. Eklund 17B (NRP)]MBY7000336.1 hypothetical protein [Clostridium botulinum]CDH91299.1 conserved hypothetical protein [Clostridium botulinum B str. Eklund 17B (NRP)]
MGKDYKFIKKNTPMDFLQKVIDEEIPRGKRGEGELNFLDLLINESTERANFLKINNILDKVDKLNNEINSMFMIDMDKKIRYEYITLKKQQVIKEISKLKVDKLVLIGIFKRINNDKKDKYNNLKKSGLLLLNIIYNSHKDVFIELLKDNKGDIRCIEENLNGSIKIYDKIFEMKQDTSFTKNA